MKNITLLTPLLIFLSIFTLSVGSAAAAPSEKSKSAHQEITHSSSDSVDSGDSARNDYYNHHEGPEFGFGGPISIVDGRFGFGAQLQLLFPIIAVPGLWVGPQVGVYHWSYSNDVKYKGATIINDASASVTSYPILAAATYHLPENAQFWPGTNFYIGAAMGISVSSGSANVAGYSASGSSTDFTFLVRPGVSFGGTSGHLFYAETQLGTMAGSFAFLPTFGLSFPL